MAAAGRALAALSCEELLQLLVAYPMLHAPFRADNIDGEALSVATPEDLDSYEALKGMKRTAFLRLLETDWLSSVWAHCCLFGTSSVSQNAGLRIGTRCLHSGLCCKKYQIDKGG